MHQSGPEIHFGLNLAGTRVKNFAVVADGRGIVAVLLLLDGLLEKLIWIRFLSRNHHRKQSTKQ